MEEHKNDKLVVRYDPAICIHAGECVRSLPSVFSLSRKPWIDVNGAPAAAIIEQVKRCPSGALTYELLEKAQSAAAVRLRSPRPPQGGLRPRATSRTSGERLG